MMNQMMAQAMQAFQQMQQRMAETQEKLKAMSVTVETGGGAVKVTVSGDGQVKKIEISPEVINPEEKEMLEDLVITGVNKAMEAANGVREHEMAQATQGLMPNIPGLNLPGMGMPW